MKKLKLKKFIAAFIAMLLAAAGGLSLAISAAAASSGAITVYPPELDYTHDGMPIYESGKEYTLTVAYDYTARGQEVEVTLPAGVEIPETSLTVPEGNTEIKSLRLNSAGNLVIEFEDSKDSEIHQGNLQVNFTVNTVEHSTVEEWVWEVEDSSVTQIVVVAKPGEEPSEKIETSLSKSVNNNDQWWSALDQYVSYDDGVVTVDPAITDELVNYSVVVKSEHARDAVTITDTIDELMVHEPGSFQATLEWWDENGLNKQSMDLGQPTLTERTFSYSDVDLPAQSILTIQYQGRITATGVDELQAQLQQEADQIEAGSNGASFRALLENLIEISDSEDGAEGTAYVNGYVPAVPDPDPGTPDPQPDSGQAFAKDSSLQGKRHEVALADDGFTLLEPLAVEYILRADLTQWEDFDGTEYQLTQNVMIADHFAANGNIEWLWDSPDFMTARGAGPVTELQPAPLGTTHEELAGDDYVGYYLATDTNLLMNVGQDTATDITITVKAQINALQGLSYHLNPGWVDGFIERLYQNVSNTATFTFGPGQSHDRTVDDELYTRGDDSNGVDDERRFNKQADADVVEVSQGQSADVAFTFIVGGWGSEPGNAADLQIVDHVDHNIFDMTAENLTHISEQIQLTYANYPTGTVGWSGHQLDSTHWSLQLNEEGHLIFEFTQKFIDLLDELNLPNDSFFELTLTLPTKPITGKQTIEIRNTAYLTGSENQEVYVSETITSASTFGNEMEVRKRIYNANTDSFTSNLRVQITEDGELTQDEFIYRVELQPHGSFTHMARDVVDVLPEAVEFLGFVNPEDVQNGHVQSGNSYEFPQGNGLTATYVDGTVTIARGTIPAGQVLPLYFKVKITEFEPEIGIMNVIGGTSTTITPSNDYPVSIVKLDADDLLTVIDDSQARFQVFAADQETIVLDNLHVAQGHLRTAEGEVPAVSEPGDYWVREVVAPYGYEKTDELFPLTVDADGGSAQVQIFNNPAQPDPEPVVGEVSVAKQVVGLPGDVAAGAEFTIEWAAQHPEVELPVELAAGSVAVFGDGVPVVLEAAFPAGTQVVLSEPSVPMFDGYRFVGVEFDGAEVSVIGQEVVAVTVTNTYETIPDPEPDPEPTPTPDPEPSPDPTPDRDPQPEPLTFAVGDVVWIDSTGTGEQLDDEFLPGVRVILYQKNEAGEFTAIDDQLTDSSGRYLFDELPSGEYQVKFELADWQKELYEFTQPLAPGVDAARNSDAGTDGFSNTFLLDENSVGLTQEYDREFSATGGIDPTWDAGVVVKERDDVSVPGFVSVGDFVWLDANGDGKQDQGEPGIEGVVLEILGPDKKQVIDVNGKNVAPIITDENGHYLFTNLPVLADGESYIVRIVRDHSFTIAALDGLIPTLANQGERDVDSSTWQEVTQGLTQHGDADLTLDFGFVKVPEAITTPPAEEPTAPAPDQDPDPSPQDDPVEQDDALPESGINPNSLIVLAFIALACGGIALTVRRKGAL